MSFTAYSKWGFLQRICHTVKLSILVKLLNFPLIHFFKRFFFFLLPIYHHTFSISVILLAIYTFLAIFSDMD